MGTAILGGTFNPIHYGHLRVSEEVRETLELDKVIFIPTFIPPHKEEGSSASPEHRLEMTRLAVKDNPSFEVSDMEIKRGGRSYSVATLKELYEKSPEIEINFIVGADSFNDITTWREYEEIFKLTNLVVVPRPGYPVKKVGEVLPIALARKFWYDSKTGAYINDYGRSVRHVETTLLAISASDMRARVKRGRTLRYLLPPEVEGYIKSNGLYR